MRAARSELAACITARTSVHALLERGQLIDGYGVRKPGAPLVAQNETSERGESAEEAGGRRLFPGQLEVGDPAMKIDQVERALAEHLVGDVGSAALRVLGLGWGSHGVPARL